jgi:hypothetical protein
MSLALVISLDACSSNMKTLSDCVAKKAPGSACTSNSIVSLVWSLAWFRASFALFNYSLVSWQFEYYDLCCTLCMESPSTGTQTASDTISPCLVTPRITSLKAGLISAETGIANVVAPSRAASMLSASIKSPFDITYTKCINVVQKYFYNYQIIKIFHYKIGDNVKNSVFAGSCHFCAGAH